MSWDILPKANLQYFLQKLKGKFDEIKQAHTIKNDSGTALADKDNLKFAGTYSSNVGDDSVVNIVRTVNSESAITQMSAAEKKGIIVVDDGQAEEIDAYDVSYGNSDVGTALDGKVNTSDIVDNLTTNDATKPLSAKQGKTLQDNKVEKSGDTMTGNLTINRENTGTTNKTSFLYLGNNIPEGTVGSSRGVVNMYGNGSSFVQLIPETITNNRSIYFPDKSGTMALLENFVIDSLLGNHYISTADTWDKVDLTGDISNYEYIGFSFARSDNPADQGTIRAIVSTAAFKNSTTSLPIVVVEDYATISDTKSVLVCYRTDTSIRRWRGSGLYTYNRLNVFGILKKS